MKNKHTPGPWRCNLRKRIYSNTEDIDADGLGYSVASANFYPKAGFGLPSTKEEAEANARLIASAPDLLEALKIASDKLHELTENAPWYPANYLMKIDEVIDKATGEKEVQS